jgi:hypothetical protein
MQCLQTEQGRITKEKEQGGAGYLIVVFSLATPII